MLFLIWKIPPEIIHMVNIWHTITSGIVDGHMVTVFGVCVCVWYFILEAVDYRKCHLVSIIIRNSKRPRKIASKNKQEEIQRGLSKSYFFCTARVNIIMIVDIFIWNDIFVEGLFMNTGLQKNYIIISLLFYITHESKFSHLLKKSTSFFLRICSLSK